MSAISKIKVGGTTYDIAYPVGSIYLSVNDTSPAELFGGTWEQLKDRFLLAAGDTYAAGTTGGSATNTHAHRGTVSYEGNTIYITSAGNTAGSDVKNGVSFATTHPTEKYGPEYNTREDYTYNQTIDIMPPYLAMPFWIRTA